MSIHLSFLFFFILNFFLIFNVANPKVLVDNVTIPESTSGSSLNWNSNLDLGRCSCNTHSSCDFRCCCDKTCSESIVNDWKDKGLCYNKYEEKFNSDYHCKNMNLEKTKHDQFFNLMCIKRDNSGDMGEFYMYEANDIDKEKLKEDWDNKYNIISASTKEELQYGKIMTFKDTGKDFILYDSDSNGNCIKTKYVRFMKNFETSCYYSTNPLSSTEINPNLDNVNDLARTCIDENGNDITNCDTAKIKGYFMKFYVKDSSIVKLELVIIKTSSTSTNINIKFNVQWVNNDKTDSSSTRGYLIGDPLIFTDMTNLKRYRYGIISKITEEDSFKCRTGFPDKINLNNVPIQFKIDTEEYCDGSDVTSSFLENYIFKNDSLYIDKYFKDVDIDTSKLEQVEKIKIEDDATNPCTSTTGAKTYILEILTSKKGNSNQLSNVILSAKKKCIKSSSSSTSTSLTKLKVKFIEIPYYLYDAIKMKDVTSLPEIPKNVVKSSTKVNA